MNWHRGRAKRCHRYINVCLWRLFYFTGGFMAGYDGSIRINTELKSKNALAQLMSLQNRIVKTADKIAALRSKMDALKDAKIPTQEYKEISVQIEKAVQKLRQLSDKQMQMQREGKDSGTIWERLNFQIEDTQNEIKEAENNLQDLVDTGKAFTLGSDTQEYANLGQQLNYLKGDYSTLIQRRDEFFQKHNIQDGGYDRLRSALENLRASMTRAVHPVETVKSSFSSMASTIKERAAGVAASIINGIAHPIQSVKAAAARAKEASLRLMSGISSSAKRAGKAIAGMAALLKNIALKVFPSLNSSAQKTGGFFSSIGSRLKGLALSLLIFNQISKAFNAMISGIKEGMGNLAKYSSPVNSSINSLKASLAQLKNSLATAFAPILTAAAPALTALINMASKAATAVGMLIAALTGQKTFVKATKAQSGYAGALEKTAGSAKKAVKALAGFDKLNVLGKNDSDDSGGSGGAGGAGVGDMFETVDIPSQISDLAKMIRDAWKNADFTEIGALIGKKLKDALDSIPWEKIQATAAKVGKSLATLINGFVEVEGLGYSIGNAIAQAINTGLIGLNEFAKNLRWDSVGKFIADGINGALINIDWNTALSAAHYFGEGIAELLNNALTPTVFANVGYTIGMGLNAALTLSNEFLKKFEWHNFGTNIGNGLKVAIETLDWALLGDVAANLLNAFFDTFGGIAESYPWSEFGDSVGSSVSTAIGEFRWTDSGKNTGKFISGLFQALKSFIDKTNWKELGKGITTAIASFLGNIDWGTVSGTISSFGVGILEFLTGLIEGVDWSAVPQGIIDAISDFFSEFDYVGVFSSFGELVGTAIAAGIDLLAALGEVLSNAWDGVVEYFSGYIEDSGGNIIQGLWNGIIASISNVGAWIYDNIFEPFIDGFKKAFGIHSPSTVMQEQGGFIVEGIKKGILEKWKNLLQFWEEKKKEFINIFNDIKEKFLEKGKIVIDGIKSGIENKWSGFIQFWSEKKKAIIEKFVDIKEKFVIKGKNIISGIKKGISSLWSSFSDFWGKKKDAVINKFSDIKEKMSSVGKNIINGIIDGIKAIWNTLTGWAQKIIDLFTINVNPSDGGGTNASSGSASYSAQSVESYSSRMSGFSDITAPQIPMLASGAVIRGGDPFLAVLGDQPRGQTNIEAPLSTIEQAVSNAIRKNGGMGGDVSVKVFLGEKDITKAVKTEADMYFKRTGRGLFAY